MEETLKKHVCVIGAGASGLTSIKACLEHGLDVTCFERTDDMGGLWRYSDQVTDKASVSASTVINTSKELSSFSDFPCPADYPNFMRHDYVMRYFQLYADRFDLLKHIRFNVEILHVDVSQDYSTTGQWIVKYRDLTSGTEKQTVFDGVLVCTGHHAMPNVPKLHGLDTFKGRVLHTHDYRKADEFSGKNVLVVGIGNSGGDAAVDMCRVTKSLHISTRHGTWCFPRTQQNGMPLDLGFTRFGQVISSYLPTWAIDWMIKGLIRVDHDLLGLRPNYGPTAQHGMANDDFPNRILSGLIKVQPDIRSFSENSVTFVDGTEVKDLDVVVLATGYIFGFPFLPSSIVQVDANKVDLYKYIFPPTLQRPTLAVIGCVQPHGSTIIVSEIQARWAVRILSGDQKLPNKDRQLEEIHRRRQIMARRYIASQRHTIQVDVIPYMDSIAQEIGCRPSIFWMLLTGDWKLALACFFGTFLPYQYRLVGPHAWAGARNAILTVEQRIRQPLKTSIGKIYLQS